MRFSKVVLIIASAVFALSLRAMAAARTETHSALDQADELEWNRTLPNFALGAGGYFLQPYEITGAASHAPPVIARPVLSLRAERSLGEFLGLRRWLFEPHVGLLFPRGSEESMTVLSSFFNADFGYGLGSRFVVSGGIGVHPTLTISSGQNVSIGGEFVTPSGTSLSWLFTTNFGAGFWIDDRVRVDAGTAVSRLFDDVGRRFRYFLEVAYAI